MYVAAAGASMVPDLSIVLIMGSVGITLYALHAGRHARRPARPTSPTVPTAKTSPTTTVPAVGKVDTPDRSRPATRREIEEFDLSFFDDRPG